MPVVVVGRAGRRRQGLRAVPGADEAGGVTAGTIEEQRRRGGNVSEAPRRMPHDLEAETCLLGMMLLSKDAIASAVERGLTASDFYSPPKEPLRNGLIYGAMLAAHAAGGVVDPVTVAHELRRTGDLEKVGGSEALVRLQSDAPGIGRADRYAELVAEHARARKLMTAFSEGREAARMGDFGAAAATVDGAAALIAQVASERDFAFEDVAAVLRGDVPAIEPTMLRRSDGRCLLYPGLLHWLMGEHGKGKSWVALHASAEVLGGPVQTALLDGGVDVGQAVMYLDWEQNRRIVGTRLASLGALPEAVAARFLYLRPPPLTRMIVERLVVAATERSVALVVCDGVAKALARQGWDEDRAGDVLAWIEILAGPLTDAGAAVLCLDHMSKDSEKRGLWARGSGAKMGEAAAAWVVRPRESFSRAKSGCVELVQAKDREGMVAADGEVAAVIRLQPHDHGRLEISVLAPADREAVKWRPTRVMVEVSEHLEMAGGPVTKRAVRAAISSKATTVDAAIELLVAEGYAQRAPKGLVHVRPFVAPAEEPEPSDPGEEEDEWKEF